VEQLARTGCIDDCSVSVMDHWFNWAKENCDLCVDLIGELQTCT
jgi:hypothetical protein